MNGVAAIAITAVEPFVGRDRGFSIGCHSAWCASRLGLSLL
jgi:hypothetical protein